jgi:hypothetical protein
MNTSEPDRCGSEGKAVIRDRCSEISDLKVRVADFADLRADQTNRHFGLLRTLIMKKGSAPQLSH